MDWQLAVIWSADGQLLFELVRSTPETRDHGAIETARRRAASAWTIVEDELKDRPYPRARSSGLAEILLGTQIYRLVRVSDSNGGTAEPARLARPAAPASGLQRTYRDSDYLTAAVGAPVVFYASILNLCRKRSENGRHAL